MPGSLILQYRVFQAHLQGYAEVPFTEFRTRVAPLRGATKWSVDETAYVAQLVARRAGYALKEYLGAGHPAAAATAGVCDAAPEPWSREELEARMRAMVESEFARGAPPPQYFLNYERYLASSMTPSDLLRAAQAREHEAAALKGEALEGSPVSAQEGGPSGSYQAPKHDLFAETYRAAGPAFRGAVREILERAAHRAVKAARPS